jgi:uncharacterized protein
MDRAGKANGPVVRAMGPGGFTVDDAEGKSGVYPALLLTPVRADVWAPPLLDALDMAALAPLLAEEPLPEFILLGTGDTLRRPPRALIAALEAKGVGIEPMDSRAAARAWGVLRAESRQVAAALYPIGG